ncbi:hypothetical protein DsansV1_C14g0130291 [Dioscorea sansibarensis]
MCKKVPSMMPDILHHSCATFPVLLRSESVCGLPGYKSHHNHEAIHDIDLVFDFVINVVSMVHCKQQLNLC